MSTTICFDFGNSRFKAAIFKDAELDEIVVLEDASMPTLKNLVEKYKPSKTILSSVIHHDQAIETYLGEIAPFHLIGPNTKLNFTTPVGKPETIGADRIAICAAAVHMYPNRHTLAISLGTCITYNFINNTHEFLGGSISPGMQMRFRSMHEQTALLPLIKPTKDFPLVGYDTKTNLLSGVVWGMAAEINGIIEAYEAKYSNFNVLLTGGDLSYFVPRLKKRIFADPNLIFKGLYAISETNQ
ncbi:MAG: type III pantothenate kinase [Sediminibacterium sp.]